jgi:hypothetical protein
MGCTRSVTVTFNQYGRFAQAAEAAITEGIDSGLWVVLQVRAPRARTRAPFVVIVLLHASSPPPPLRSAQNCHLVPGWLPRLQQLASGVNADTTHKDFRLILTTDATDAFGVSLLHGGTSCAAAAAEAAGARQRV